MAGACPKQGSFASQDKQVASFIMLLAAEKTGC
jgi:hypothetical protein